MWDTLVAAHDLGRLQTLVAILSRYGFGDLARRLGLVRVLARAGRVLPLGHLEELVNLPAHTRVRRAMEEMGPSFVKLGQVLATRVDLFPPDWIAEFSRLHSTVPPVPFEAIRAEMAQALGAEPEAVFAWIDPAPLAAGSIAQVHRAKLPQGRDVVAKVRRPGISPIVAADLRLLRYAARKIEARFVEARRFHPVEVVRQFAEALTDELNLASECRHADRVGAAFAGDDRILVPKVHWDYTNEHMNVQDFADGVPVADLPGLLAIGADRMQLARTGAQVVLKMVLEHGFFHADPHPGNILVLPGGRIALIDFGMVGRLSRQRREEVVCLLFGLVERDAHRVAETLLDWTQRSDIDEEQLSADVDAFVDRYYGVPLGQLDLSAMLLDTMQILRRHGLALPADLALLVKVCLTLEGLGRLLDPGFDMASQARPFLRRAIAAQFGPAALARRGARTITDAANLIAALPRDLGKLMRSLKSGHARLRIDLDEVGEFSRQVAHSANRLAGSMVISALIVGSSIAMTVKGGPTFLGLPVFGLLGFVGASLLGIWLLSAIFRSGGGK
ncbi:AarF/UbiB family protein [Lysobacter firmicutimachus]|uniref:AarF/UbiB family protein n=1 Tax=Lysobacter firmicutimachus TaxID=1792846 RepID=A0AAU8MW61_9GAMM